MKTINVTFEDKEYDELIAVKKDEAWRQFILSLVNKKRR